MRIERWVAFVVVLMPGVAAAEERLLDTDLAAPAPSLVLGARRLDPNDIKEALKPENRPCLACGASMLLPGTGQFINGECLKGSAILGGFTLLSYGMQALFAARITDERRTVILVPMAIFGAVIWGWSMWDAFMVAKYDTGRW